MQLKVDECQHGKLDGGSSSLPLALNKWSGGLSGWAMVLYDSKQKKKEYMKKWREKNPDYDKKRYSKNKEYFLENKRKNRRKKNQIIKEYKRKHPCKCGEKHPCALDFHHLKKDETNQNISDLIRRNTSLKKIFEEIDKCIVVCANCHRKIHCSDPRKPQGGASSAPLAFKIKWRINMEERDREGLLISHRCERLKTINGQLLCDGVSDDCTFIECMREGCYYDCILM